MLWLAAIVVVAAALFFRRRIMTWLTTRATKRR